MRALSPLSRACLAGLGFTVLSAAAQAGFIATTVSQAPKSPLSNNPAPPPLTAPVADAVNAFNSRVTVLGSNEYESVPSSLSFSYGDMGNGSATGTGGTISNGRTQLTSLGRYNTSILPPVGGEVDPGNWLETNGTVEYVFRGQESLSALSFFGTDFGDFGGIVSVQLLLSGGVVFNQNLTFPLTTPGQSQNGSLLFFSLLGETSTDTFDTFRFVMVQSTGQNDSVGIDSFRVGTVQGSGPGPNPMPEPGALALTGLALAAAAIAGRRRGNTKPGPAATH